MKSPDESRIPIDHPGYECTTPKDARVPMRCGNCDGCYAIQLVAHEVFSGGGSSRELAHALGISIRAATVQHERWTKRGGVAPVKGSAFQFGRDRPACRPVGGARATWRQLESMVRGRCECGLRLFGDEPCVHPPRSTGLGSQRGMAW